MGLVRAAQRAVGRNRLRAARHAAALGQVRGVLAEKMDQAHLIEAMDEVMRRLGGTARVWRTDRLATVIVPGHARRAGRLRPGGQALRGRRRALSAAAGQPQGCGRVLGALRARAGGGAR